MTWFWHSVSSRSFLRRGTSNGLCCSSVGESLICDNGSWCVLFVLWRRWFDDVWCEKMLRFESCIGEDIGCSQYAFFSGFNIWNLMLFAVPRWHWRCDHVSILIFCWCREAVQFSGKFHVAITTLKVYMFSSCYLTLGGRDPGFLHPTKGLNKSDTCCHRQTAVSTRGARSSWRLKILK